MDGPGLRTQDQLVVNGKPSKGTLLCFWDYDTQWGADRSRTLGGPKTWGADEFPNTDRLLELHREFNVPACFAVVGSAALPGKRPYHDPDQVRRIYQAGHEIASHSFRHEWLPELDRLQLRETLRRSKETLEDCIGAQVVTFVPPYNQPFDYVPALSISLSERRAVPSHRTDLSRLCEELCACGYQLCRVAYRSLLHRISGLIGRRDLNRPGKLVRIADLTCVTLNTACGFDSSTIATLERTAEHGGIAVVYGHPHSITADNSQNVSFLQPFLERASILRNEGRLRIVRPSDLLSQLEQSRVVA